MEKFKKKNTHTQLTGACENSPWSPTKMGVSWQPEKIQTSFLVVINPYISEKRADVFEPSQIFVRTTCSTSESRDNSCAFACTGQHSKPVTPLTRIHPK